MEREAAELSARQAAEVARERGKARAKEAAAASKEEAVADAWQRAQARYLFVLCCAPTCVVMEVSWLWRGWQGVGQCTRQRQRLVLRSRCMRCFNMPAIAESHTGVGADGSAAGAHGAAAAERPA